MRFSHEHAFVDLAPISPMAESAMIVDDWNSPQPEPYTPYAFLIEPNGDQTELPNIPGTRDKAIQSIGWLQQSKKLLPGVYQCWLSSREYPGDWESAFDLLLTDQKQICLISESCLASQESQKRSRDSDIRIATEFSVRRIASRKCRLKIQAGNQPRSAIILFTSDNETIAVELFLRSWTDLSLLVQAAGALKTPTLLAWVNERSKLAAFADGIANALEDNELFAPIEY
jgi:hypothetical protein